VGGPGSSLAGTASENNNSVGGGEGGADQLANLNSLSKYDLNETLDAYLLNDDSLNPFTEINIDSKFFDNDSFLRKFKNTNFPIFLSLNVQCLPSKFENLKSFIISLVNSKVPIIAIALQEVWSCPNIEDKQIPGFKIFLNCRKSARGGGVGFYVRNNIDSKIVKNLTLMNERIFESIGLEIKINNKKMILANYYRSPNPPP